MAYRRLEENPSRRLQTREALELRVRPRAIWLVVATCVFAIAPLLSQAADIELGATGTHWLLQSPEWSVRVSKTTGLPDSIRSLNPSSVELLPGGPSDFNFYFKNLTTRREGTTDGLQWSTTEEGEHEEMGRYVALSCELIVEDVSNLRSLFSITVRYEVSEEQLTVDATVSYLRDFNSGVEIGFYQRYDPDRWSKEYYPGHSWVSEFFVNPSRPRRVLAYADMAHNFYDFRTLEGSRPYFLPDGQGPNLTYPMALLESGDRFFLSGYLDLGRHTLVSPNNHGGFPSFFISPTEIRAGDSYRFDFVYKTFARPENALPEVFKWYSEHMYSSNPVSRGYVRRPENLPRRSLHPGNLVTMGADTYGPFSVNLESYDATRKFIHDKLYVKNIYLAGWFTSDEELYELGVDRFRPPFSRSITGYELKSYIQEMQSRGYRIYLYFRQFLRKTFPDRAPFDEWVLRDEHNKVVSYVNNVQPEPDGSHLFADFLNEDFRNWYMQTLRDCVEFYEPDGIAWDMGWYDVWTGYVASQGIEGAGIHHGILRVQAEVYKWIQDNHPDMRVIVNLSGFSPSALYVDAAMQEGGWIRHSEIQAMRAFNLTAINLAYPQFNPSGGTLTRAFGSGATWAFPTAELFDPPEVFDPFVDPGRGVHWNGLGQLAELTAIANGLYLVSETPAVEASPSSVLASAWARDGELLLTVFNDLLTTRVVTVKLDRKILRDYGLTDDPELDYVSLRVDGLPSPSAPTVSRQSDDSTITIQTALAGKSLLGASSKGLGTPVGADHVEIYPRATAVTEVGEPMTLDLRVVDEAGHQFAETVAVKVSFSRPVEIQSTNLLNGTWEDDSLNGTIVKQVSESSFTFTLATPGDVEVVVTSTALPNVSGAEPFRVSFFEPPEQVILEPFTNLIDRNWVPNDFPGVVGDVQRLGHRVRVRARSYATRTPGFNGITRIETGGGGLYVTSRFDLRAYPYLHLRASKPRVVFVEISVHVHTLENGWKQTEWLRLPENMETQVVRMDHVGIPHTIALYVRVPSLNRAGHADIDFIAFSSSPDPIESDGFAAGVGPFIRGDCNGDGEATGLADSIFQLTHNFLAIGEMGCRAACDVNGDGDISGLEDVLALLSYFFFDAAPPPGSPFPDCGEDPETSLDCEETLEGCA